MEHEALYTTLASAAPTLLIAYAVEHRSYWNKPAHKRLFTVRVFAWLTLLSLAMGFTFSVNALLLEEDNAFTRLGALILTILGFCLLVGLFIASLILNTEE